MTTFKQRRELWMKLSGRFDEWNKMTDKELFNKAFQIMPGVSFDATRTELLKILVMDHTYKMVP